jgi:hypothetical protein
VNEITRTKLRASPVPVPSSSAALNALPDILFLHDPEEMVPLFRYTGCSRRPGATALCLAIQKCIRDCCV